jgi:non-heme chloroperoxidase
VTREIRSAQLSTGPKLPYVEQGDNSGTPVLFLHAYVESWRFFERLLPHLPRSIHAFVPTQRGHGDADRPPSGYRIEDFSGDLSAFMDEVGLEAAVLGGSSSGGYVAQRFALDHPERTLGLALIGAPRSLGDKPAVAEFLEAVRELSDPVDQAFARAFLESGLSRPLPSAVLAALVVESCKAPAHVWKAALEGLLEAVPPTETGTITAPTLILWGDRDHFLPRSDAEGLAAAIPGSRLESYEGTGHLVLLEEPERVAADVVSLAERIMP